MFTIVKNFTRDKLKTMASLPEYNSYRVLGEKILAEFIEQKPYRDKFFAWRGGPTTAIKGWVNFILIFPAELEIKIKDEARNNKVNLKTYLNTALIWWIENLDQVYSNDIAEAILLQRQHYIRQQQEEDKEKDISLALLRKEERLREKDEKLQAKEHAKLQKKLLRLQQREEKYMPIIQMRRDGMTHKQIAHLYGVTPQRIQRICSSILGYKKEKK